MRCSIKPISPPINYGGEPSVPTGIMSQLPSSHLSIHRVPAKLIYRVMPYGRYSCRLRLLFVVGSLLTGYAPVGTDRSVDATPPVLSLVSRYRCRRIYAISHGFLFQTPARPPICSVIRQGSGSVGCFVTVLLCYAACSSAGAVCLISFSILSGSYFCPVLKSAKMILRILQAITISDCIFFSGLSGLVV